MEQKRILYFDKPGPQNTAEVIKVVRERLEESDIKYVVVASSSGDTAVRTAEALRDTKVKVVAVTPLTLG